MCAKLKTRMDINSTPDFSQPGSCAEYWRIMNARASARQKVCRAVKAGTLVRPIECPTCGGTHRIEAHHENYEKPLDVVWMCAQCHYRQHGKLPVVTTARQ
jgi:ribosomal protein S27AE